MRLRLLPRKLPALAVLAAAAAALPLLAGPASADSTGTYVVSRQDGVTFQLLNKNDLLLGTTDDALFRVGTGLSGANHMPFPVTIYGVRYNNMTVSSNGNLQLGVCCTGGNDQWVNDPLPSADFTGPALSVFWDDLYFVPDDPGHFFREGIYTRISGKAPHRKYTISWQGHSYSSESYYALAQVTFTEGSQTFRYIYGASDAQGSFAPSETIGTQSTGGSSTTLVAFNPTTPATTSGRQYTFQHTS